MSLLQAIVSTSSSGASAPPSTISNFTWDVTANEGATLTLQVYVNNWRNQRIYWEIMGGGSFPINPASDITGSSSGYVDTGTTDGWVTIGSITWAADSTTEGTETWGIYLGSTSGNTDYGFYGYYSLSDTSAGPTYDLGSYSTSVNEGGSLGMVIATSNVADGTTLYWTIDYNSSSASGDFGSTSGSFVVNSNYGTFSVPITADSTTEGSQTFKVQIRTDSITGTIVGTTTAITINDTSTTPVPASFDLVNPPSTVHGLPWVDNSSGVSATVVGGWFAPSDHGGAVGLNGSGYIEVSYINTSPDFTLSFAADLNPTGGSWNSLYSGGNYGTTTAFAYLQPGGYINAGSGQTLNQINDSSMSGLAWWDFVNDSTGTGNVFIYKNGTLIGTLTATAASGGFGSNMWIGLRHGSSSDYLYGNIYRIKYTQTVLDQTAITSQYNAVKSTYGLS